MEKKSKTAKARAEAKFKMVGTKLNEDSFNHFKEVMEERGFETPSAYIRFLIDLDSDESIEEERKQNSIMTRNIELYKERIKELEDREKEYLRYTQYTAAKIKEWDNQIKKGKKSFFNGLWGK